MGLLSRKVRTASGATAVQIASKQYGVQKIVEHIGSPHTPEDLEFLPEVARTKLQAGQLAFDLDRLAPQKVTATAEIVASRTGSAPRDLAEHYERGGNLFEDGQTIETTRSMGTGNARRQWQVAWQYSRTREKRDDMTLNKQIDRAEQIANGSRAPKKDRFVTLGDRGTRSGVNWTVVGKARSYLGLKGYVASISAGKLTGAAVVAAYHDLFRVEASFRMAKSDWRARPVFHHECDSIEAHFTIVFAVLAVTRHVTDKSGYAIKRIVRTLRSVRDAVI